MIAAGAVSETLKGKMFCGGKLSSKAEQEEAKRVRKSRGNTEAKAREEAAGALWRRVPAFLAALARTHTMEQIYTAGCGKYTLGQRENVMEKCQKKERNVYCLQAPRFCFLLPESIICKISSNQVSFAHGSNL